MNKHQGQVKWFNKKKGYGFVIDLSDNSEVFVHHKSITPLTNCYHLLYTGEYVEFEINKDGKNGPQCEKITGIGGGKLMCDVNEEMRLRRRKYNKTKKETETN